MTENVLGFDLGHRGTVEAEHWLSVLLQDGTPVLGTTACTHLVHGERPRVVVTVTGFDPGVEPSATPAAEAAVTARAARDGGRAFLFPGVRVLAGTMTVGDLLAASAIDAVRVMGGSFAPESQLIDTRGFVRPAFDGGRLVLVANPAPGGLIAPFEVPNPTPCCGGDH